jgi:hypothetical protein
MTFLKWQVPFKNPFGEAWKRKPCIGRLSFMKATTKIRLETDGYHASEDVGLGTPDASR